MSKTIQLDVNSVVVTQQFNSNRVCVELTDIDIQGVISEIGEVDLIEAIGIDEIKAYIKHK